MAHSFADSAPTPGGGDARQKYSAVEVGREGPATIVRLVLPEAVARAGRLFTELTDLAIAGRGRLVICLCKATECTQEWLNALSSLARRCEVLGGRLIVCGAVNPLEEDCLHKNTARRSRESRCRHAATRAGSSTRDGAPV